jgi:membrane protein DedA with SNARE-associated domain
MTAFYLGFLTWIHSSRYLLLFIGAIIEGPVLMVTAGFLLKLNQFNLVPMYFALIAGDFTADMGWYAVGYFGARPLIDKVGRFLNITPEIIAKIEARFKMYQDKILFISKITMGLGLHWQPSSWQECCTLTLRSTRCSTSSAASFGLDCSLP